MWALKYRKWVLQGEIRRRVRELFQEIANHHLFKIEARAVEKDHVQVCLSCPPRHSMAQVGGMKDGQCHGESGRVCERAAASVGTGVLGRRIGCSNGRREGERGSDQEIHLVS